MKTLRLILPALILAGSGAAFDLPAKVEPKHIVWNKELIITDVFPVEKSCEARPDNPKGRFTLQHLLEGIAKDRNPETAARQWLNSWVSVWDGKTYEIGKKLLKEWEDHAHTDPECPPGKQLCFRHAPFRLLAIVNRPDVQKRDDNLQPHSAGEVRFVFGITDASGGQRNAMVIFEYDMKGQNADDLHNWQDQWHGLRKFALASDEYCEALATITEQVVAPGVRPDQTNGSALKKIRTNELALSLDQVQERARWNLREFELAQSGEIVSTTTAQTPPDDLANSAPLVDYVNAMETKILESRYEVPKSYQHYTFLGTQADIPLKPQKVFWLTPETVEKLHLNNRDARDRFARNTCSGCHGAETHTNNLHVFPRDAGKRAKLSKFINRENTDEIMDRKNFMCAAINRTPMPAPITPFGTPVSPDDPSRVLLDLIVRRGGQAH